MVGHRAHCLKSGHCAGRRELFSITLPATDCTYWLQYILIIIIVWISKIFSRRPPVKMFVSPQDLEIIIGSLLAPGQRPRKRRKVRTTGDDQQIESWDQAGVKQPLKETRRKKKLEPKQEPVFRPPDHDLLSDEQAMKDFVAFLALFGEDGVSLRELIMLACYRYLEPPPQAGLLRGSGKEVYRVPDWNFLRLFAHLAGGGSDIRRLRGTLVERGSIKVIRAMFNIASDWPEGDEIWISATHIHASRPWQSVEAARPGPYFNWSLLQTFTMASQTFDLTLEDRLNQILTQYGRIAQPYLTKEVRFALDTDSWWSWKGEDHPIASYIDFILNLITRHTESNDSTLLDFVHTLVKTQDELDLHADQFFLKLRWAELKVAVSCGKTEEIEQALKAVDDFVRDKMSVEGEGSLKGSLRRALEATMLADLMQSLQAADLTREWHSLRALGREWCSVALKSPTDLTMTAACKLIPQLEIWHRLAEMPLAYHTKCAHQLSRLGYIPLAWRFFRSGEIDDDANDRSIPWRLRTDYVAMALHIGQIEEAKKKLLEVFGEYEHAQKQTSDLPSFQLLVGDRAEQGLTIYCLLSDILVAEDRFAEGEAALSNRINQIQNVREDFIFSMRLALRSRLIKIQINLEAIARASTTCLRQNEDVIRFFRSTGRFTTLQWTMDELIASADEMADQGQDDHSLKIFRAVQAELVGRELPGLADMKLYVQSRVKYLSQLPEKDKPSKETSQQDFASWVDVNPILLLQPKEKPTKPYPYIHSAPVSFTRESSLHRETNRLEIPVAGPKTDRPMDASLSFKDRRERYRLVMRRLLRLQPPPKTEPGLESQFPAVPQTKITESKAEKHEPSVAIPV